jgi:hypothetical protein
MYVFSIDIPFKARQSLAKMRSKGTTVPLTQLCQIQRYRWHRYATDFVEYFREFEAIFEKALTCVARAKRDLFDEKYQMPKISCQGHFNRGIEVLAVHLLTSNTSPQSSVFL